MKKILAAFAGNIVFANIFLMLIFLSGWMAATSMIRETFPEFSLDMITISVQYPGADPEEVEEGICLKIEEAIKSVAGIKQFTTESAENFGSAVIEIKKGYVVEDILDKIRTKVNSISTFPVNAEKPIITELILNDAVMLIYLSGDMSEKRIKEWASNIEDEVKQLPEISQTAVFGARDYEINIEVSEEKLRKYNISLDDVSMIIAQSNLNLAGGTIRTEGEDIRLRTIGRKYTGKELSKIVILTTSLGEIITLGKLADIKDGFTQDPINATINGEQSLILLIFKTKEEDSLGIANAMQKYIAKKQMQLPPGVNIKILYDNTETLRSRIDLLLKNGLMGLFIVFALLWAFLNTRLSFWAGMGIPISIAGALAILWACGGTINMISLLGLILVLGIVVDDAIVVGEAIYVHRNLGKPPLQAAIDGVSEVGMPVFAAVITTIIAFIPLMYVGGIMGKFISILPVVVIACLVVSLFECLLLLPAHLSHLPDINKTDTNKTDTNKTDTNKTDTNKKSDGFFLIRKTEAIQQFIHKNMEWFINCVYVPFLSKALTMRYILLSIAIAILFLTIGLVKGGLVKFEVFPEVDGFVITSTVEFPAGTPSDITAKAVERIDNALMRLDKRLKTKSGDPLLKDRLTLVGQTMGNYGKSGPHFGAVQGILLQSELRGIHSKDLMIQWEKEVGNIAGVKSLTFETLSVGPPGSPIEIWLQGKNMNDILAAADELMEKLGKFEGVYQIRSDFSPGKNEIRLKLKPEARMLGITVNDLAKQIYAGYYGKESLRLQRGQDDIRVKVRYTASERERLSELSKMRIKAINGSKVPLISVADISYGPGFSTITRTDGLRRVAVSADVDSNKANTNEIFAELASGFFAELEIKYPGLHVALQGEQKKMRESFDSLYIGFFLAVIGIFIIIATMFRSYTQPFIIMFTIPFGLIGGVVGHLLFGYNLSIMSIFGLVALTGVVVNDAIVLIERINENIIEGANFFEAIIEGGRRRFRAIFLTSLSTIGGLAPLIMETDLQAQFLIPMALSIAAGVAFATVLTLVLIPSLLVILNDFRIFIYKIKHGKWPKRIEVEPAYNRKISKG